jgi:hypothetical protein
VLVVQVDAVAQPPDAASPRRRCGCWPYGAVPLTGPWARRSCVRTGERGRRPLTRLTTPERRRRLLRTRGRCRHAVRVVARAGSGRRAVGGLHRGRVAHRGAPAPSADRAIAVVGHSPTPAGHDEPQSTAPLRWQPGSAGRLPREPVPSGVRRVRQHDPGRSDSTTRRSVQCGCPHVAQAAADLAGGRRAGEHHQHLHLAGGRPAAPDHPGTAGTGEDP